MPATLTIELPEDLAERVRALAAEQGRDAREFAIAAVREAADEPLDPDLAAALREGLSEWAAGQLRTQEEVDVSVEKSIRAALAARSHDRA